jgi:hypothetical protein
MNNIDKIEIRPENSTPKGFIKFAYYSLIGFGLLTLIGGIGLIFIIFGVWALFINPKNVEKNYPVSYTLTTQEFIAHRSGGGIFWSIPWSDIESIYIVSFHWAAPKSLGLKLKEYSNFHESIERSKLNGSNSFSEKFKLLFSSKIFVNKYARALSGGKSDIMIPYQGFDRSAQDFADLLQVHVGYSSSL